MNFLRGTFYLCHSFRRTCQPGRMGSFQLCLQVAAVRRTFRGQKNFSALLRINAPLLRKIKIAHHKPHLGNITAEQLQEVILSFDSLKITYDFSTFKVLEISIDSILQVSIKCLQ